MLWSWKWVVLWSLWAARLVRQPTAPLRVAGGLLRGAVAPDGSHRRYLALPYATLQTHSRFQASKPYPNWDGILDLYEENVRCPQRFTKNKFVGREECLTLNVYTPLQASAAAPRPVMVFIHGGGFRDGSSTTALYGPEYLVSHDVILVTINYRLEVLGFLCLGIEEAPGNVGLKDQVEALRWVRKNIRAFGGDPDNITLFGESAGSASVMYHLLSPMSRGLFHKAILQSGSIGPWSFQYEPLKTASDLAKQMGYDTDDPYKIHKIFMNKTAEELLMTRVPRASGDVVLSENIFVPCMEKKLPGVESFLDKDPFSLLSTGRYTKVPIIIGYNNAEGYMFVGKENDTTIANMNFYDALPRDLVFPSEDVKMKIALKLQQLYMGDEKISKDTLIQFSRYEGESGITFPVTTTIDRLLKTNNKPMYTYKFCYDGWLNLAKLFFGTRGAPGATHADELFYIFKPTITLIHSFFETEMVNRVSTMWTNFAKFGNPTPEKTQLLPKKWLPASKRDPKLLVINNEFSTAPLWAEDTILFWNTTYAKFRRKA